MAEEAQPLGLYVSVPFCRAKCSFCNFASGVGTGEAMARYVSHLCKEIGQARKWARELGAVLPESVDTVYFGGGTPSLLEPEQLRATFTAVRGEFAITHDAEITMEAAPGQVGDELLETAFHMGVNRISLGVQSLVDREAQAVGRSHTEASCRAEFARLRAAGLENLGIDLIAGLPYQTEASWDRSLAIAGGAKLDHLSVYMLEIDEESRLGREVLGGGARLHAPAVASEELCVAMYERACASLPDLGFAQYEISNFAQPGRRSRHNEKYWTRRPYLGTGLDAHSMLLGPEGRAVRWANPEELTAYMSAETMPESQWTSDREAFEETVFLGLRLLDGLAWDSLRPFCRDWVEELQRSAGALSRDGLLQVDAERLRLTGKGRLISGEIFGELLAGITA